MKSGKSSKRIAKAVKRAMPSIMRSARRPKKGFVAAVKNIVTRQIARTSENKQAYLNAPGTIGTYTAFNNSLSLSDFIEVVPRVSQGDGVQNREGNQIKMKGCYVKGHVSVTFPATSGTITTGPTLYVRLLCLIDKSYPGTGVGSTALLERNGLAVGVNGYVQDLTTPIDKNRFQVLYDKVIRIQNPNLPQNLSGYVNTNVITTRAFRFKIPGRVLKYTENSATLPSMFCPNFAAFVVDPSYILPPGSIATPCQYTLDSTMYFED